MKRRVALVSAIVLTLVSSIPTYAGTDFLVPEDNSEDIVVSQKVYDDVITEELAALEDKYDMTKNMPEEVLAELSEVAEVSKEVEQLDDEYMQVSYNIFSEEPIMERTYNSGNTVHTLMVFDGWGDTVRYLNFDFDSWTDISGTTFNG